MKNLITSTWARWVAGIFAAIVIFLLAFGFGVSVGYQKAIFASEWGRNYELNFAGVRPPVEINPEMEGGDMHGVAGTVIDISTTTLAVKDDNNDERAIVLAPDVVIKKADATVLLSSLAIGDHIVAIGAPNEEGQVEAHFIRVFPAPGPGIRPQQ